MSFTSATTSCGLLTALISLAACSADERPCAEDERTIDRGVYGEIIFKQFDGPDTPLYDVFVKVTSFDEPGMRTARSNKNGFFEIALPAPATRPAQSTYQLCTDFATSPCWTFTTASVVRIDLIVEQETQLFWDEKTLGTCPD